MLNDPKGIGAFILAGDEMQIASMQSEGKRLTATLDNFFNHEMKKDITDKMTPFHYLWNDMASSGFSLWGGIFRFRGVETNFLRTSPTSDNLKRTNIYIIVDPDTKKETKKPNYISTEDGKTIYNWVKSGGVLVLMANDSGSCEFTHLNQLAGKFGIHFNEDSKNDVQGHHFEQGALWITLDNPTNIAMEESYHLNIKFIRLPATSLTGLLSSPIGSIKT